LIKMWPSVFKGMAEFKRRALETLIESGPGSDFGKGLIFKRRVFGIELIEKANDFIDFNFVDFIG